MIGAPKVRFLLEVAGVHPAPCVALSQERPIAGELVTLGLLNDLDEDHPGCFGLSPKGAQMVAALEHRVSELP